MRKAYLDNIRWLTQIFVVLYHVFYMYNAQGVLGGLGKITSLNVQYYDIFLYAVYPYLMLILFIVSGICSRYYLENHSEKEFIKARTTKLLVPSTIGLFAFQFVQGYVSISLSGAFDSMTEVPIFVKYLIMVLSGTGVLWYLQILWIFSLILILVRKIEKDRLFELGKKSNVIILILLAIPVWLFSLILNTPVVIVYRFGFYGIAFFLGYFIFSHDEVIETLKKYFFVFLALSLGTGIAFCILYFGKNYADKPINQSPLFVLYAWFASLTILGGSARFFDFENELTLWLGRHSFGLYVFHYLGISTVALCTLKFTTLQKLPAVLIYLLSAIAGFAGAYILNAVISRLPFFKWAVLGIKRKE